MRSLTLLRKCWMCYLLAMLIGTWLMPCAECCGIGKVCGASGPCTGWECEKDILGDECETLEAFPAYKQGIGQYVPEPKDDHCGIYYYYESDTRDCTFFFDDCAEAIARAIVPGLEYCESYDVTEE